MFRPGELVEISVRRITPMRGEKFYYLKKDTTWIQCVYIAGEGDRHHIKHHTHEMVIDENTAIRRWVA